MPARVGGLTQGPSPAPTSLPENPWAGEQRSEHTGAPGGLLEQWARSERLGSWQGAAAGSRGPVWAPSAIGWIEFCCLPGEALANSGDVTARALCPRQPRQSKEGHSTLSSALGAAERHTQPPFSGPSWGTGELWAQGDRGCQESWSPVLHLLTSAHTGARPLREEKETPSSLVKSRCKLGTRRSRLRWDPAARGSARVRLYGFSSALSPDSM